MANIVTLNDLKTKEEGNYDYCANNNMNATTLILRKKKAVTKEQIEEENKIARDFKEEIRNLFEIYDDESFKFDMENLDEQLKDPNAPRHAWLVDAKLKIKEITEKLSKTPDNIKDAITKELLNICFIKNFNEGELDTFLAQYDNEFRALQIKNEHTEKELKMLKNYIETLPEEEDAKKNLEELRQFNNKLKEARIKGWKALPRREQTLLVKKRFHKALKLGREN